MSIVVDSWSELYRWRGDDIDNSVSRMSAMVFMTKGNGNMAGLKYLTDGFLM